MDKRVYSHYCKAANIHLGQLIKLSRKQRKWSEAELAERAGIARATLQKIEKGDLRCEIGLVFETAALVGLKLFDQNMEGLHREIDSTRDKIALLPHSIRKPLKDVDDDF